MAVFTVLVAGAVTVIGIRLLNPPGSPTGGASAGSPTLPPSPTSLPSAAVRPSAIATPSPSASSSAGALDPTGILLVNVGEQIQAIPADEP